MGGALEKMQYPKKKFSILQRGPEIFCVLQNPKNPRGDSTLIRFHPIVPLFKS